MISVLCIRIVFSLVLYSETVQISRLKLCECQNWKLSALDVNRYGWLRYGPFKYSQLVNKNGRNLVCEWNSNAHRLGNSWAKPSRAEHKREPTAFRVGHNWHKNPIEHCRHGARSTGSTSRVLFWNILLHFSLPPLHIVTLKRNGKLFNNDTTHTSKPNGWKCSIFFHPFYIVWRIQFAANIK